MTLQRTAALCLYLHSNAVDVELSAFWSSNSKLYILVLVIDSGCWPITCRTCWCYECAIAVNVAVCSKTFVCHVACGCTATFYSSLCLVCFIHCPCSSEWIATTEFYYIDSYRYFNLVASLCSSNSTFELAYCRKSYTSIEGLDKRAILVICCERGSPVLFVGRKHDALCCSYINSA